MVVLSLLITSSVSFTYSSSEAANAGVIGTRNVVVRMEAVVERNSRRRWGRVVEVVVGDKVAEMVVGLILMGGRDLGVEVGVMSVGEAMVVLGELERNWERFCDVLERKDEVVSLRF